MPSKLHTTRIHHIHRHIFVCKRAAIFSALHPRIAGALTKLVNDINELLMYYASYTFSHWSLSPSLSSGDKNVVIEASDSVHNNRDRDRHNICVYIRYIQQLGQNSLLLLCQPTTTTTITKQLEKFRSIRFSVRKARRICTATRTLSYNRARLRASQKPIPTPTHIVIVIISINMCDNSSITTASNNSNNNNSCTGNWRTQQYRDNIIAKLNSHIAATVDVAQQPLRTDARQMEANIYQKAHSEHEYMAYIARLLVYIRGMLKGTGFFLMYS